MSKQFYRIGTTAEGKIYEEMNKYYYGLTINANLVQLYSTWLPALLDKLRKPFFVDPITYCFSFDINGLKREGVIKKSFDRLIKNYGISQIIINQERELLPDDFFKGTD
jgi:hypothetical protein